MKLELKHLAPYLPYKLKIYYEALGGEILPAWTLHYNGIGFILGNQNMPILRPLSDFHQKVDGKSFSDMISHGYHNAFWTKEKFNVKHLMYHDLEILLERHADVFGLIEAGLAIDINTLKK